MSYPDGIATELELEYDDGSTQVFELALGPSASLGDLHGALERFAEAFTLQVQAYAFSLGPMRLCLFDPENLVVAFDEDDDGAPDPDDAMDKRFAFAFIAMLGDDYNEMDPWLVVRPCNREHVQHWKTLLSIGEEYTVRTWCLDERLTDKWKRSG